ncbi:YobA family protein [Oceanobacillus chungangensis]|uniref:DUF3221 domain-containing protein n=1 Tax=Oceanobacillus chungangensis TaxID=1229152 RepID=A0A3D8PYU3_9BACI|nr:YobA family protein [Oceanobacillus chungangensis]RDW20972.1 hypothetical protein CWR45_03750 [Oceanobacillus chungangensis]
MSNKIIYLAGFLFLILVGCSNGDTVDYSGEPGITGYVIDKIEESILIVNPEAVDFSETGGKEEFYDAVWANNSPEDIKVGDQVNVWFDAGVQESYPGQASVGKIEIIPSSTSEGATLSDNEALNKAITAMTLKNKLFTVRSIVYDSDKERWTIIVKNIETYEEHTVQVEDK